MRKILITMVMLFLLISTGLAAVPQIMTVQGKLTDGGAPATGIKNMRFAIVNGSGAVRWESDASNSVAVTVNNGIYNIKLGDITLANMAALNEAVLVAAENLYVRVWVEGSLLSPDIFLSSTAYALVAGNGNPVGTVQMFAGSTAPDGWLICDGSAVSRTTYAALFAAIGSGAIWGTGDGSTTFNLPDMRACGPYGVGASTKFTTNETVSLGQYSNDMFQGHYHALYLVGQDHAIPGGGVHANTNNGIYPTFKTMQGILVKEVTEGTDGAVRVGSVTKGKTVGMNFIIKY